jgi:quercetin dioxygenase-like cupin family protein
MSERPDYPRIRRIVTGHGDGDVARVLVDGPATNEKSPDPGLVSTLIWSTDRTPAPIERGDPVEDMGDRTLGSAPPLHGTRFCVIDFPPGNPPARHRTDTLDYVIVLEGEIDMDLDDSTVHLKAGDVMVQRGTYHAWVNRGTARARIAVVLVDGIPLGIGKPLATGSTASAHPQTSPRS